MNDIKEFIDEHFPYYEIELVEALGKKFKYKIQNYSIEIEYNDVIEGLELVHILNKEGTCIYSEFVNTNDIIDTIIIVLNSQPDLIAKGREYKINQVLKN